MTRKRKVSVAPASRANRIAFALVIGVVTGTYSSVAAASLIVDWEAWSGRRRAAAPAPAGRAASTPPVGKGSQPARKR
jgi:hypothetical protein